jgi:hypothetical protein
MEQIAVTRMILFMPQDGCTLDKLHHLNHKRRLHSRSHKLNSQQTNHKVNYLSACST